MLSSSTRTTFRATRLQRASIVPVYQCPCRPVLTILAFPWRTFSWWDVSVAASTLATAGLFPCLRRDELLRSPPVPLHLSFPLFLYFSAFSSQSIRPPFVKTIVARRVHRRDSAFVIIRARHRRLGLLAEPASHDSAGSCVQQHSPSTDTIHESDA